jgi:hypothetical protein
MKKPRRALLVAAALVLAAASVGGKDKSDPRDLFREMFRPIEKTMGIRINPGKFKVKLFSGKVGLPSIVVEHPVQGKWAVMKNVEFPLGFFFGTSDPRKNPIAVGDIRVEIDLGRGKFWDRSTPDGKPAAGSPDLVVGKVVFESADIILKHGKGRSIVIEGTRAALMKVRIPAESWSRGDAPEGVWARASMRGGKISLGGAGLEGKLKKLDVKFDSEIFSIQDLAVDVPGRGGIAVRGTVDCKGAEPHRYDLSVALDGFALRPGSSGCGASGVLELEGKKKGFKLRGAVEAGNLEAGSWKLENCSSDVKFDIVVKDPAAKKKNKKAGKITGSICKGRIFAK